MVLQSASACIYRRRVKSLGGPEGSSKQKAIRLQAESRCAGRSPRGTPRQPRPPSVIRGLSQGSTGVFQRPSIHSRRSLEGPRGLQEWPKRAPPRHLGAMSVDFPWGPGGVRRGSSLGDLRSSSDAPGGPTDFDPGPQGARRASSDFLRGSRELEGPPLQAPGGPKDLDPRGGFRGVPRVRLQRGSEEFRVFDC